MRMRLDRRPLIPGRLGLGEVYNAKQNVIRLVQIIPFPIKILTLRRNSMRTSMAIHENRNEDIGDE